MPSHDLPSTELRTLAEAAVANPDAHSLLNQWKKELNYDFKREFGQLLQKITDGRQVNKTDKMKIDILCKAALSINSLDGKESKGRTQNAVQVNVVTVDPTKR